MLSFFDATTQSFRLALAEAVSRELRERINFREAGMLSKPLSDFLDKSGPKWRRVPPSTRLVALLDVFCEKYICKDIGLDALNSVFEFVKLPPDKRNAQSSTLVSSAFLDRSRWTKADVHAMNNILTSLHEAVLRELFETALHCYETEKHPLGPAMMVPQEHIESDPAFIPNRKIGEDFRKKLGEALQFKAKETYNETLHAVVPEMQEAWEFFHVSELGQSIVKLCNRIQKRYKNGRTILGYVCLEMPLSCVMKIPC